MTNTRPLFAAALAVSLAVFVRGLAFEWHSDERRAAAGLSMIENQAADGTAVPYRPLSDRWFALDRALWDRTAWPYRLENVLLHALAGWLVFLILHKRLDLKAEPAAAGAFFFLAHPAQGPAVGLIAHRPWLAAAVCVMSAFLLLTGAPGALRRLSGFLFLAAGLLFHEIAAVFPFWLAAYDRLARWSARWRALPVTAFALTAGWAALRHYETGGTFDRAAAGEAFWGAGRAAWNGFAGLLVPVSPAFHPFTGNVLTALAGGALIVVLVLGTRRLRRAGEGHLALAGVWFFTALAAAAFARPDSPDAPSAFLYLPVAGAALAVALGWDALEFRKWRWLLAAPLVGMAVWTASGLNLLRDEVTLRRAAVSANAGDPRAWTRYAEALDQAGRVEEAARAYETSLAQSPPPDAAAAIRLNLARLALLSGRHGDALAWVDKAEAARPDHPDALRLRRKALLAAGRLQEAETALHALRYRGLDDGDEQTPRAPVPFPNAARR